MEQVKEFARGPFAAAKATYPNVDQATVQMLSKIIGIPSDILDNWKLDPDIGYGKFYLTSLLQDEGLAVGAYDGRVTANDTGIAGSVRSEFWWK